MVRLLPMLPDGDLRPADARRVEAHLAVCDACRREAEVFTRMGGLLRQATVPAADLPTGAAIAARVLEKADNKPQTLGQNGHAGPFLFPWFRFSSATLSLALALALAVGIGPSFVRSRRPLAQPPKTRQASQPPGPPGGPNTMPISPAKGASPPSAASWSVARLAGAPRCGSASIRRTGRLRVGQWLETDSSSRARISVANIGHVEIEPNTRVRLVQTRPQEHRLALDRGALRARISAPPRLFLVDTPSATAVDLGCSYTLQVDDAGGSHLHVTTGWVALERDGREAFVPEGGRCETRPGLGLGTPYLEDAPRALRTALAAFDFGGGGARALATVLATARQEDSLTLWHLLSRAAADERGRVYDRLKALTPPPRGVTRDGVLLLDKQMLALWRREIEERLWREDLGLPW